VSSKYTGKLFVRVGEWFPRILRGLFCLEIRGTDAQFASGVMRSYRPSFAARLGSSRNQSARKDGTRNDETRISNDEGMTKPERQNNAAQSISDFVIEMAFRVHPA